jgi:hypothetical protein
VGWGRSQPLSEPLQLLLAVPVKLKQYIEHRSHKKSFISENVLLSFQLTFMRLFYVACLSTTPQEPESVVGVGVGHHGVKIHGPTSLLISFCSSSPYISPFILSAVSPEFQPILYPKMKFILTGCMGFIGEEVLYQCLRNPSITSVVALTRRKLPETLTTNLKLKEVVMKDFNAYPESVLKELCGADACIWYANLFL